MTPVVDAPDGGRGQRRNRASDEVAFAIVEALLAGGRDRYLSEQDALQELGVGRGTYREALRHLQRLGVIDVRSGPGGGPAQRAPDPDDVASVLALWLEVSRAPLRSVLEAREVIEPGIARLAAVNASSDDIDDLRTALEAMQGGIGDIATFAPPYRQFWTTMAAATGNPLLSLLGPALRKIVNSGGFVPDELYRTRIVEHLHAVLGAIADRQPDEAEAAAAAIDAEFKRRLASGYPRQVERPVAWRRVDEHTD